MSSGIAHDVQPLQHVPVASPEEQQSRCLSAEQVFAWAETHLELTGKWPTVNSGPVLGAKGELWHCIDMALWIGERGLPGDSSLAGLISKCRGLGDRRKRSKLTIDQILGWADAHHRRTGLWPKRGSGPVLEADGSTTWNAVNAGLRCGGRGLPGGTSLSRLLVETSRQDPNAIRPPLSIEKILAWADAHHQHTGRRATMDSGPVLDADGETWMAIDRALRRGSRGLTGGTSLSRLLKEHRP